MNTATPIIGLINLDATDDIVIRQAIAHHLPKANIISVEESETSTDEWPMADIYLSTKDNTSSSSPILVIDETKRRIGHILDDLETRLYTKKYDDITYKTYRLHWQSSTLHHQNHAILLTETEQDIIAEILKSGDAGCPRDQLLRTVWGYRDDIDTHTLETHIYRLRQKIETEPDNPQFLITIEGGYKLISGE